VTTAPWATVPDAVFFDRFAVDAQFGSLTPARKVLFDRACPVQPLDGYADYASHEVKLTCRTVDVASVTIDMPVTVMGDTWRVATIQPDGTGITVMTLHRHSYP
jgi:hypothetical protein